ncbi:methyl-accepting chemotaxis protein [Kushneria indalinina]|uniref:Methyl-accepting chemotaxis protein n=1 Tax=Kushneria indalinina DSM 14324 TaxID=1122140 RepID=A0A3D9DS90_9GAMM|nr:methyl-accepting chemotaxis protein [Kushneria indalinina]REC93551.1 methyl-accepting chemotaxis protein [Kushneria indalinina DSM 14324]
MQVTGTSRSNLFSGFRKHADPSQADRTLTEEAGQPQGMTLRRQMLAGIAIMWLILVGMLMINAWQSRGVMYTEREARLTSAVDMAESLVQHYQARVERGELTDSAARQQAFDELRSLRFDGGDNYVYVVNGNLQIMAHPKRPYGQDVSGVTDPAGRLLFQDLVTEGRANGQGFTEYRSNFARGSEAQPRVRAFVSQYQPWDIYLASGVFMGDVNATVLENLMESALVVLIAGALLTAMFWWGMQRVLRRLGGEPAYAAGVVRQIADGDLTAPVSLREGDRTSLLANIRSMRDALADSVRAIQTTTQSVDQGASEIASGNQELSSRTEQQAAALEETSSSMEQMTASVRQSAESADQARQLAQQARDTSREGQQAIDEAVQSMAAITEGSTKIADIVSLIDSIAFQTNLLALNASVEAARAGEEGRGFAVVAGEVRQLANRSASAAQDIKALIDTSGQQVGEGAQRVQAASERMGDVDARIQRMNDLLGEIAAGAREQSSGIEQINQAVSQMDQSTQHNAALVEQTAAAAGELEGRAQELREFTRRFNVEHQY